MNVNNYSEHRPCSAQPAAQRTLLHPASTAAPSPCSPARPLVGTPTNFLTVDLITVGFAFIQVHGDPYKMPQDNLLRTMTEIHTGVIVSVAAAKGFNERTADDHSWDIYDVLIIVSAVWMVYV